MWQRYKTGLTLAAALLVLFVVVCPYTPTPTAVVKGKRVQPQWLVMFVLSLAMVFNWSATALVSTPLPAWEKRSADLIDLTCNRLC
jgi:hypothetical protein